MPHLQAAFDQAPGGAKHVIELAEMRRTSNAYLRKVMMQIIKNAELEVWPRVFHNMRSSRQTELEQSFPSDAVCKWLGNSQRVAHDHYLQMTEELIERATSTTEPGCKKRCSILPQAVARRRTNQSPNSVPGLKTPEWPTCRLKR